MAEIPNRNLISGLMGLYESLKPKRGRVNLGGTPSLVFSTPLLNNAPSAGLNLGPIGIVEQPTDRIPDAGDMAHEERHAQQYAVPGWTALRLIDALYPYEDKPLERDAFKYANQYVEPNEENLVSKLAQKYVNWYIDKVNK